MTGERGAGTCPGDTGKVNRHFTSVQILRGIAALAVVLFHISEMLLKYTDGHGLFCRFASTWHAGAAGVDLFFLISGFVMVQSTRGKFGQNGSGREFMLRRLVRIVPLYWLYTSVMLILVLLPFTLKGQVFSGPYTLLSYLFIPALNPTSGLDLPLLAPGWTLSYEMYFYAIFAVLLRFEEKRLLPAIGTLFLVSAAAGLWLDMRHPVLKVLTSPLLLEFLLGCLLARWVQARALPSSACYVMIVCGTAAWLASRNLAHNVDFRLVVWGVPAFLLLAGCVFLERAGDGDFAGRTILRGMGDSSYSTYLSHTFVILAAATMLKRDILLPALPNDLLVVASIMICLLTGYLSYIVFEKNFSRILLNLLKT